MKNIIPFSVYENDNHHRDVISNTNIANQNSSMRGLKCIILFAAIALASLVLLSSFCSSPFRQASYCFSSDSQVTHKENELDKILKNASMENKTVILTTLNGAWAKPNSMFDLFIESFRIGIDTEGLLKHLVVICMDDKAYARCLSSHPHCYQITKGTNFKDDAVYYSSNYLKMMWIRLQFLASVLRMGYSFVFTDTDIIWLRNPFKRFFDDADFQIACDTFNGNSSDRHNDINGGFKYVRSNKRSIEFYDYWYKARETHPGLHEQDVLNRIKFDPFIDELGIKIKLFDTVYFGGYCEPSRDANLVCTMHANCCIGHEYKFNFLSTLLEDWKRFTSSKPSLNPPWTIPKKCRK